MSQQNPAERRHVAIVGSGNAALCAGIAALEAGARVTMLEKASPAEAGGNSRYTAGAMRFAYAGRNDILALLRDPDDPRVPLSDFGSYPPERFAADIARFNAGEPLNQLQEILVSESYATLAWLNDHHVGFDPIFSRQAYEKNGRYQFWGGLTLETEGEGAGLVAAELLEFRRLGGHLIHDAACQRLIIESGAVTGIGYVAESGPTSLACDAVILACGGFEANRELRRQWLGEAWAHCKVRGTRHNTGDGLTMALAAGAALSGAPDGCHAVPMDLHMPDYANLELPFIERKHYRKICYFLGVMLNASGNRFVDEGSDFRNYTYAQFGRAILGQPGHFAWQVFDARVADLLYEEYRFRHASSVSAGTLDELVGKMDNIDQQQALSTIEAFNAAVDESRPFDPTILDGRCTHGLALPKSNWANRLDTPPFTAYPVTCGITFTYMGVRVNPSTAVLRADGEAIPGLYACGEMIGDVFRHGYPGGSGLTSGAVFGRRAGAAAAVDRRTH